jgi:UPF0176 protein
LQKKAVKIKKNTLVKALTFPEIKCWTVLIEENELTIGDTVLIKGSTTGEQILKIEKMMVNDTAHKKAVAGDTCTFQLPFRIRLSDKLYRI